jgi:cytochrome c55X
MARAAPLVAAAVLAAMTFAGARAGAVAGDDATTGTPDTGRQRELLALLHQDCGSCHGMRLTGGLGPALTPEKLRTRPAESLAATIVSGRPGTAMPPWRRFVSEAEARWLVARMVSGDTDVPR